MFCFPNFPCFSCYTQKDTCGNVIFVKGTFLCSMVVTEWCITLPKRRPRVFKRAGFLGSFVRISLEKKGFLLNVYEIFTE